MKEPPAGDEPGLGWRAVQAATAVRGSARFQERSAPGPDGAAGLVAGVLDIDLNAAGENPEYDPSYAAIFGEYTAVLNDWVRRGLKFETDLPYEILTGKVRPWSYDRYQNRYLDVAETLLARVRGRKDDASRRYCFILTCNVL